MSTENVIHIRRAVKSDLLEIRNLYKDTIMSINSKDYSEQQINIWSSAGDDVEMWNARFSSQHFIVAESEGVITGFASLADGGYIDFMFVHKNHQGKGLATEMLSFLESEAIQTGCEKMWAEVSITARPFFRKRGFEITERFSKRVDGVEFDDCVMTKFLNTK